MLPGGAPFLPYRRRWMERACEEKPHARNHEHWFKFWYILQVRKVCVDLREIIIIPMPYGYVQQLRIFLMIWLVLLLFGLVESNEWLAVLWTPFIAFGIVGIEKWSHELANPFGEDVSDVPSQYFVSDVGNVVKRNSNVRLTTG
ncbi:hypothetical protein BWQ96_10054 [Gracilariopsis chorda]|uniref:Uncharacterized protein n=1 Tax=Gracilariopsis chorda TaxID=448386 RepID=A0A2V3IGH4_9FLOR|nr:hypothetical protein BWQ96_10054 [Gracilariopsis chorda]|eukprot:PXF40250.1 hypothetical protein BWQ96_10054 [Gracilariopsis chorda]